MTTTGLDNTEFSSPSINDATGASLCKSHSQKISVKVTDYSYGNVNPSPIKLPKNTEIMEEFLSPRKLQALTGVDNLETVEYLEMRVNTDQMSLGNFGMYLPNLSQIKLSGSYIPRIRDLGTSLWNLQVLWMPQCCLQCLDGLVTMANIKELYLAYNDVEDISSCGMLENLEILDLEGNRVEDSSNLHYLSMCSNLSRLTLEGNPLCSSSKYDPPMTYRKYVFDCVPQLEYLDDISVKEFAKLCGGDTGNDPIESSRITSNATLEFEEHWNFINSMLIESGLIAESDRSKESMSPASPDDSGRPPSSCTSSARLNTAIRPLTAQRRPLTTSLGRPGSSGCQRPATAASLEIEEQTEDSNLTAGHIVCGNITKSLRRHSEETQTKSPRPQLNLEATRPKTSFNPRTLNCDTSCDYSGSTNANSVDESCEIVLEELNLWRQQYEKSKARIEKQKAPQILTIEYSEDEIEELDMTTTDKRLPESANPLPTDASNEGKMNQKPLKKLKAETKLNPIKNGKLSDIDLPSSWLPNMKQQSKRNNSIDNSILINNSPATTVQRIPTAPQMSRIRRQLLQSGVSTITPSKPLLKR